MNDKKGRMGVTPLFSSTILSTIISENTDALLTDESYVDSHEEEVRKESDPIIRKTNDFHVLNRHPHIKEILLNEWLGAARNVFNYYNKFAMTTSWITKTDPGSSSQKHSHSNSFWSGVYYFDEYDKDMGDIEFSSPLRRAFELDVTAHNIYNSSCWRIAPKRKQLLLFPSYLDHQVLPNKSKKIRRSLAFNIIPVGKYGTNDSSIDTASLTIREN